MLNGKAPDRFPAELEGEVPAIEIAIERDKLYQHTASKGAFVRIMRDLKNHYFYRMLDGPEEPGELDRHLTTANHTKTMLLSELELLYENHGFSPEEAKRETIRWEVLLEEATKTLKPRYQTWVAKQKSSGRSFEL